MLNCIIFSKDRACQLHALLESWDRFATGDVARIVLCRATAPQYELGYKKLQERLGWLFNYEEDFRHQVLTYCRGVFPSTNEPRYIMFAMDDQVIRHPVNIDECCKVLDDREDVLCVSLRLAPNVTKCYMTDAPSRVPLLHQDDSTHGAWLWRWQDAQGDWGYPMSQDTTIFRTTDLLELVQRLPWHSPNQMEGEMSRHPIINRPFMACYDEAAAINIPANLVQTTCQNRTCNGTSVQELNDKYLSGEVIDIKPILKLQASTCHVPYQYTFRKVEG